MISSILRLICTVFITVALLQACVGCTTTKAKQSRITTVDSTYRAIRIDSSTVLHKYEGSANSNDKYERVTTITPTIIHDSNVIRVYPTTVIREVGEKVTEIRYVDSSAEQRKVLLDEVAALKKEVKERSKDKRTNPNYAPWLFAAVFAAILFWVLIKKKAT